MPFVEPTPASVGDTRELTATGPYGVPPEAMSADPKGEGTGASGPQFSLLDAWAGQARQTVVGRLESNVTEARGAGLPWWAGLGLPTFGALSEPEGKIPPEMASMKDRYAGLYTQPEIDYRTGQLRQEALDARAMAEHPWTALGGMALGLSDPIALASMAVPIAGASRLANAVRLGLVGAGVSAADEAILAGADPMHDFSLANVGTGTIVSGLLGAAIRPRVPLEELARLQEMLDRELSRPIPEVPAEAPAVTAPRDDAASLGRDLRAAVDEYETEQRAAGSILMRRQAGGPAEPVAPGEGSPLLRAQAPAGPVGPEPPPAPRGERPAEGIPALRRQVPPSPQEAAGAAIPATLPEGAAAAERPAVPEPEALAAEKPRTLEARLAEELEGAGVEPRAASDYARLVDSFYATQAARLGLTPEALFEQVPLTVRRGPADLEGALAAFAQREVREAAPSRAPYQRDLFGRALPPTAVARPGPYVKAEEIPGRFATRSEIVEEGEQRLASERITTPDEAAQAAATLARSTREHFVPIVTDRNGRPLAIVGATVGKIDASPVFPGVLASEAFRVRRAAHLWLVHNHPSGVGELSQADRLIMSRIAELLRGSEIETHGIVAVAGGAEEGGRVWHWADHTGNERYGTTKAAEGPSVPVLERRFTQHETLGPRILAPVDAVQAARSIAGKESGLILVNNAHEPIAFLPLEPEQLMPLRGTGGIEALTRALSVSNAAGALIVDAGRAGGKALYSNAQVGNLLTFLEHLDARTLDLVRTDQGRALSGAEGFTGARGGGFEQAGARGLYVPGEAVVHLLERADPSTFLHEAGHHFLDLTLELASRAAASGELRDDARTLLDWFGVADLNSWRALGIEGQRAHQEKFATAFESYLKDGLAPSPRLADLFARFRDWLVELYRGLRGQFLERASPEVRGVMDRMLASAEEARAARLARAEAATSALGRRLATDGVLGTDLREMAEKEGGWQQVGGRLKRNEETGEVIGRTSWLPNSDWWPGRPGGYSHEDTVRIVDKALAGERLGPKQQQLVEYMTEVLDARRANAPALPLESEFLGFEHLKPSSTADSFEMAMAARATLIDAEVVENLARRYEDDHNGFLAALKSFLDAHDADARIARRGPPDRPAVGIARDGFAARRAPRASGGVAEPGAGPPRGPLALPAGPEPLGGETAAAAAPGRPAEGGAEPEFRLESRGTLGARGPEGRGAGGGPRQLGLEGFAPGGARVGPAEAPPEVPLETGRPDDLFSQAARQVDLEDLLQRLPPERRAPFEARLTALESAGRPSAQPIIAAPGESTAGAMRAGNEPTLEDLTIARGGRALAWAIGWFHPGIRLLRSPSAEARRIAIALGETPETLEMNVPTRENPAGRATPEAIETVLKRWEGAWLQGMRGMDRLHRAYQARELAPGETRLTTREFYEAISHAMRTGDRSAVPEVADAARLQRRMVFDPLKAEAQALGLLGRQGDLLQRTAESYLMRQVSRAKVKADPLAWHTMLREAFIEQGVSPAEADTIAHGVTDNVMGSERGLLDRDDTVFREIVPQSGRLKARSLMLPDLKLEPFLVNDIRELSHAYVRTLAPEVEITRRFGDRNLEGAFERLREEYAVLRQRELAAGRGAEAEALRERQKADIRDLGAIRDRMYGIFGAPADPSAWYWRAGRVLRSGNVFRLLGTALWSHLPDIGNIVLRHGLPQTMATAAKLASSLEALKLNRDQLQALGTAGDMIHNSTAAAAGAFGEDSAYPVQRMLTGAGRAYLIATLEIPWIASIKALGGAIAQHEFLGAAERLAAGESLSDLERIRLNQAGLSDEILRRAGAQYREFGQEVNGLRFGLTDRWRDREARQALEAAIVKHAEASTLTPGKADTPLWTSTEWGKALFQFKTFGAVAVRKVVIPLAQGIAHGDLRAAQGLATLIAAGAASYAVKQLLAGQPLEKDPERFALEVLDKSNLLGWTGEFFYPALWSMGAENFSRWSDRQAVETLGGPVFGTALDLLGLRLPAKIRAQIEGPQPGARQLQGITRADIHRWRRLLPGNQYWPVRRMVNHLEGWVGDEMGLPPEKVRGSTE